MKFFAFSNHKSHIFLHVYMYFPYSSISQNFLELFHFPKITRKWLGFPGIREISFKVETLSWSYHPQLEGNLYAKYNKLELNSRVQPTVWGNVKIVYEKSLKKKQL